MSLSSSRMLFLASVFIVVMMLASVIAACGTSGVPPTSPTQAVITWPFHPTNNDQWAIVNGYRGKIDHALGGSPNNYAHLAFDFAICPPDKVIRSQGSAGSCDLTNGWDTANTDGKVVYSPVTGHVRWIDDGKNPSSTCRSLGIELDNAPGYYIALAHVQQLSHNNDPSKPIHLGNSVGQDEPIGVVSGATDGGCYGGSDHIHMALYSLCSGCDPDKKREAVPFSDKWSIGGCSYSDNSQKNSQHEGELVPCNNTQTQIPAPVPTPTQPTSNPVQRTLTSQQTQSQTVNATGQGTTPGTQAKGILSFRNPYHGSPKGVDMTLDAGTVFDDDTNRTPNVQMMIDATITVPGDGTSVTVPAHVVPIGTIGNISQIRGWTHYGAYEDPVPLDIYNSTPFTGGTDPQTYTVVKQSDIDTAANSLQASTRLSAVADLNSQLQSNEHLVGDPQCTYDTTSDHAASDQVTTVTVTVKATCTATAST